MGRTLNGVTDGNEGGEQFAVWIAHQEEIKVKKRREEMELFEWGCWMQNLSGRKSKCWEEAGWVWVMQQIFFFPPRSCVKQMLQQPTSETFHAIIAGKMTPRQGHEFNRWTEPALLFFSLLHKWAGISMVLSGISEILWHAMIKGVTACLLSP